MNKSPNLVNAEALLEAISQRRAITPQEFESWGGVNLVGELRELGVPLSKNEDGGYELHSSVDFLDEATIRSSISPNIADRMIINCLKITDSTNVQLMRREIPQKAYMVMTSELQIAGRGRRGRHWLASYGEQLALSLGFMMNDGVVGGTIPLNAALAVRSGLLSLGYEGIGIKWPNDLYVGGRKVGGILVEAVMDRHIQKVVVGIGINLAHNMKVEDQVDQPIAFLGQVLPGTALSRNRVASAIIESLVDGLSLPESGPELQRKWTEVDICFGQQVSVHTASGELEGVGAGIGMDGEFILKTTDGELRFHSGEISLRLKQ